LSKGRIAFYPQLVRIARISCCGTFTLGL